MPVQQFGQPLPYIDQRRAYRQVQHGLPARRAIGDHQPLRVVDRDRGARRHAFGSDGQARRQVEAPQAFEQPVQVPRCSRPAVLPAGQVAERLQADPPAPVEVQQDRLAPDGAGILGQPEQTRLVMLSEPGPGRVEDHWMTGSYARAPHVVVDPLGRRVETLTPGPHHPRGVVGLVRLEPQATGGPPFTPAQDRPAVAVLGPVLDRTTEGDVGLPHLTVPEPCPLLADDQVRRPRGGLAHQLARPETEPPQSLSRVQHDPMARRASDPRDEVEPVQPVRLSARVGDAGAAPQQPGAGQLHGEVQAQSADGVRGLHDDGVGVHLGDPTGDRPPADQRRLRGGEPGGALAAGARTAYARAGGSVRRPEGGQQVRRRHSTQLAQIPPPMHDGRQTRVGHLDEHADPGRPQVDPVRDISLTGGELGTRMRHGTPSEERSELRNDRPSHPTIYRREVTARTRVTRRPRGSPPPRWKRAAPTDHTRCRARRCWARPS